MRAGQPVWDALYRTLVGLSTGELVDLLVGQWYSIGEIPRDLLFCPCHGLWYSDCKEYG